MGDNLNEEDIDNLIKALTAWEHEDAAGSLMGSLMVAMASRGMDEEKQQEMELQMKEKDRERDRKRQERVEKAILLKAKLLYMKRLLAV